MNSTVIVHMVSGTRHEVRLTTEQAGALRDEFAEVWTGRRAGPEHAHTLHFADGTSATVNPHHVEAVELR